MQDGHANTHYTVVIFAPGSMNMRSVRPSVDTPTEAMTDFEKVERV